ncbi:endonuclease/exonuclease/phosphatase family protein [Wohlfahrtiimonas larvae]|uniref:Endonuclease/exonuclease/phosphatase domain-containing protein n=1 Tax=Wohlfahrtiimonas larvae TaxID=1157986 RepID=A0ABP9MHT3_9GAMM|nr:endonuclease/exonuclease/phosphatase family protein [Wohlfahrtiimonas larvae]
MKNNNKHKVIAGIKKRLQIIAILSVIALTLGQLGKIYWVLDLFSHFTWLYLLSSIIGIFVFKRIIIKVCFCIMVLALLYISIQPIYFMPSRMAQPQNMVSLVSYNLSFDHNEKMKELIKLEAKMSDPNLVLFAIEYNSEWDTVFKLKYKDLYQCGKVDDSPFGLALYSPLKLDSCEILYPIDGLKQYPYIRAEHKGLVIYGIHPPPPINSELANIRDESLMNFAVQISNEKSDSIVVMGDFNISPYSPVFRDFINTARVFETKNRLIPTWSLGLINIDHILVRNLEFLEIDGSRIGWWRGSDHRPIFMNYRYY